LRGANRDPNEQKPTTPQKDAGPEEVGEGDVVKVDTTLVSIPVAVMDRDGKYIPDLTKDNFRVWENDVEQKVAYFASTEKPFTVALVIDYERFDEIQDRRDSGRGHRVRESTSSGRQGHCHFV
jgi:hypothetical protein